MATVQVCQTFHHINQTVSQALVQGLNGKLLDKPWTPMEPGPIAMYGMMRGLKRIYNYALRDHRNWFYADRGYLSPGHYDGYYRLTRNAIQCDGRGEPLDPSRVEVHDVLRLIRPWRRSGSFVLICPPTGRYANLLGFHHQRWKDKTKASLKQLTDRQLRMRVKNDRKKRPFHEDLRGCWCVVTHSSNVVVESVLRGVPVIVLGPSAGAGIGGTSLKEIESPPTPDDRERWLRLLACHQWTLAEIRSGKCRSDLLSIYGPGCFSERGG